MNPLATLIETDSAGVVGQLAQTFGVDWPHLLAQTVSFAIVCLGLYALAYQPILRMLETRRRQIAQGLANAEQIQAELARTKAERAHVLAQANAEGVKLVEEARTAAARVHAQEAAKSLAAAERIIADAKEAAARERLKMLGDLKRELARLVIHATAAVTGKVLTSDDQRRMAEEAIGRLPS